jgi:hypothetical protein
MVIHMHAHEGLLDKPIRIHVMGGVLTLTTLAALGGGGLLLLDPSGSLLGMSVADMGSAPFRDFMVPGAVLLALFGLLPIPVLVGLWREARWATEVAGMIGVGLAVWITAQVIWLGPASVLQAVIWVAGVALASIAGVPRWTPTR